MEKKFPNGRIYLVTFLLCMSHVLFSQMRERTSLYECWEYAENSYTLQKEKDLISLISELERENIRNVWMPKPNLFMQATYQSDVITIDPGISMPGLEFPVQQKDQYKLGLDLQQVIYDGGLTRARMNIETSSLKSDLLELDVQIYQLKEVVSALYFSTLILRQNMAILEIFYNELQQRIQVVHSGVKNGIVPESNLWQLDIERLKLEQKRSELKYSHLKMLDHLSELTAMEILPETELLLPEFEFVLNKEPHRPEHDLFDQKKMNLVESEKLLSAARRPTISAFAQTGYGRPGLNMLSEEFDAYYLVGLRLGWTITDWNQSKRERKILHLQNDRIDVQQELFDTALGIKVNQELLEISRLKEAIEIEQKTLEIREKLLKVFASRLDQGIIQPIEYLSEFNSFMEAKVKSGIDEIMLMHALTNYYYHSGDSPNH
jgi:outer membrane protein TolC